MSDFPDPALFENTAIAFDLDGTLVDTAPDLVRALNETIRPAGLGDVPLADVRAMVGRGARALLVRAFEREAQQIEDAALDDYVARFIEVYKSDVAARSIAFEGVHETLAALKQAGARLSVCTNKPSVLSDLLLAELELDRFFERVIGPERTSAKKPDAAHIHSALGSDYRFAAMVGDSAPDADAARAAGVPAIIMTYGYSEKPASSLGADRLLDHFRDVPHALGALWQSSLR